MARLLAVTTEKISIETERRSEVLVTLGPYNSLHWLREGEDHREGVMVGVGYGAVNFRMKGVDWSSGEHPVDDFFALYNGTRRRRWRVAILKCIEKLRTGEEVQS